MSLKKFFEVPAFVGILGGLLLIFAPVPVAYLTGSLKHEIIELELVDTKTYAGGFITLETYEIKSRTTMTDAYPKK